MWAKQGTVLIDVVLANGNITPVHHRSQPRLLRHGSVELGEDEDLVSWDVELFQSFTNDSFRLSVGIDIGRVPLEELSDSHPARDSCGKEFGTHRIQPAIIGRFQELEGLMAQDGDVRANKSFSGRARGASLTSRSTNLLLSQHPRAPIRAAIRHSP